MAVCYLTQLSRSAVKPIPLSSQQCRFMCKGAELRSNAKSAVYGVGQKESVNPRIPTSRLCSLSDTLNAASLRFATLAAIPIGLEIAYV